MFQTKCFEGVSRNEPATMAILQAKRSDEVVILGQREFQGERSLRISL